MLGFTELLSHLPLQTSHLITFLAGILIIPLSKRLLSLIVRGRPGNTNQHESGGNLYNLSHGRLNINPDVPMWMNMGYWSIEDSLSAEEPWPAESQYGQKPAGTLAVASRTLLTKVLATAGFNKKRYASQKFAGTYRSKAVIDLGFGCGEQTIYMNSGVPLRDSDKLWWDSQMQQEPVRYIGITLDKSQHKYAQDRVRELQQRVEGVSATDTRMRNVPIYGDHTHIFRGDAAKPNTWDPKLQALVQDTTNQVDHVWVLALDTLYHFSPSRMPVIEYACRDLNANLMAFDLCLAPNISIIQLAILRVLTALMGAPWTNFITKEQYEADLRRVGYKEVEMVDISQHVFGPLATFLENHDRKLSIIGYGIGPFHLAKWMFGWWARTGIVRGMIVVARKSSV